MRRSRRISRLIILSLVLAHLTTWAVAWGVAVVSPDMAVVNVELSIVSSGNATEFRQFLVFDDYPEFTNSIINEFRTASPDHPSQRWGSTTQSWAEQTKPEVLRDVKGMLGGHVYYYETAMGWPLLSHWLWAVDYRAPYPQDWGVSGGMVIDNRYNPRRVQPPIRALPYLPIYRGLIINTLFYSLLWIPLLFLASRATRALKHRARSVRGLCPNCKYDLNGIKSPNCPECGMSITAAPSPSGG